MSKPAFYDAKCDDLARHFLADEGASEERVADLARTIQQAVEDWLDGADQDRPQSVGRLYPEPPNAA